MFAMLNLDCINSADVYDFLETSICNGGIGIDSLVLKNHLGEKIHIEGINKRTKTIFLAIHDKDDEFITAKSLCFSDEDIDKHKYSNEYMAIILDAYLPFVCYIECFSYSGFAIEKERMKRYVNFWDGNYNLDESTVLLLNVITGEDYSA